MTDLTDLFERYQALVKKADAAFNMMMEKYGACISCKPHCSDCCHAIFGLFPIEAAHIQHHFQQLGQQVRNEASLRAGASNEDLRRIEEKLHRFEDDPHVKAFALSKERVRCPLLDQKDECVLYPYRPVTCRVYGIPTAIHGKAHVCGMGAFQRGESYPTFNLDTAYRELHRLSRELLGGIDERNREKASLMISVSRTITTPLEELISKEFQQ